MKFLGPPQDVPAHRLFRLLLQKPRPILPLQHRMAVAPHVPLFVRALTPMEFEAAIDNAEEVVPMHVLCGALWTKGGPAFNTVEQIERCSEREINALLVPLRDALNIICPVSTRIDRAAWELRLTEGAREVNNWPIARMIGLSALRFVPQSKTGMVFEPALSDYFGLPFSEITEGQYMAYAAGKTVFQERCV